MKSDRDAFLSAEPPYDPQLADIVHTRIKSLTCNFDDKVSQEDVVEVLRCLMDLCIRDGISLPLCIGLAGDLHRRQTTAIREWRKDPTQPFPRVDK